MLFPLLPSTRGYISSLPFEGSNENMNYWKKVEGLKMQDTEENGFKELQKGVLVERAYFNFYHDKLNNSVITQ